MSKHTWQVLKLRTRGKLSLNIFQNMQTFIEAPLKNQLVFTWLQQVKRSYIRYVYIPEKSSIIVRKKKKNFQFPCTNICCYFQYL